jgi:hypothetical protein
MPSERRFRRNEIHLRRRPMDFAEERFHPEQVHAPKAILGLEQRRANHFGKG